MTILVTVYCTHNERANDNSCYSILYTGSMSTPLHIYLNLFISPSYQKALLYYNMPQIHVKFNISITHAQKQAMVAKQYRKHQKSIAMNIC